MARQPIPLLERIYAKTDRTSHHGGCWIWTGALSEKRDTFRPVIQLAGRGSKVVSVARIMCALQHGDPDPERGPVQAGHTCPHGEEPKCVRPDHLEWMTPFENSQWKRTYRERVAQPSNQPPVSTV